MGLTVGIAGGGIAGLALAAALQKLGRNVIVLERQPEVRDGGAGISLWPNALAALDSVGLGREIRPVGRAIAAGGEKKLDGRVALRFSERRFEAALGEGLVCVERGELVRVLATGLNPGTVRAGHRVIGFDSKTTGVTIRLDDGDELVVDALVGADGINSAVAAQMNGSLRSFYSGYTAWRGIADLACQRDEVWACLAQGHEVGWMPVSNNRSYWFATSWLPQDHVFAGGHDAYLKETFRHWPEPVPDLIAATPAGQLVRNDITDRAMPERWSHGPVTVIGDAAHPMRPHLGQGGCQAIEDAVVLARCLATSGHPSAAFARYEQRRRRRAGMITRLSRLSSLTRPAGPGTNLFDRLTNAIPNAPIGPAVRAISPIAGYRAGQRAVHLPD